MLHEKGQIRAATWTRPDTVLPAFVDDAGEEMLEAGLFDLISAFKELLDRRRTLLAHEVEQLRRMGLARGGSLDNAVVIAEDRILNREGLRFPDEFVRHKLLDAVGDLYLAGGPIMGRFHGHRAGHALNNQLLRTLFASEANWRWTTISDESAAIEPRGRASLAEVLRAS